MQNVTPSLALLLNLAVVQSVLSRKFDGRLVSLGLTEFLILLQLERSPDGGMRRIDLAESVGLTASGVTRLLAPMEKIGLVKREDNPADARVSLVALAKGGRQMLADVLENAERLAEDALAGVTKEELSHAASLLRKLGGTVR